MTFEHLPPIERARAELGAVVKRVHADEVLTEFQTRILGNHLEIPEYEEYIVIDSIKASGLGEIAEKIGSRRAEDMHNPQLRRRMGRNGLLGLAVGAHEKAKPLERAELLESELVRTLMQYNPDVDPNVLLDKSLEFDIAWLGKLTATRVS